MNRLCGTKAEPYVLQSTIYNENSFVCLAGTRTAVINESFTMTLSAIVAHYLTTVHTETFIGNVTAAECIPCVIF